MQDGVLFVLAFDNSARALNSRYSSTFDSATRLDLSGRQVHRTEN
jgi:hypothetical protein